MRYIIWVQTLTDLAYLQKSGAISYEQLCTKCFWCCCCFVFFYFIDVTLYFRIQNAKSKPKTCAKTSIIFVIKEHSCNQKKLITVKNSNTLQFFKQLSFICFLLCSNLNFCIILLRDLVWLCLLFFGVASSYINPVEEIPNQILKTILFQLIWR